MFVRSSAEPRSPEVDSGPGVPHDSRTMADKRPDEADLKRLAAWERCVAGVLGLALLALVILAVVGCFPTAYEWNGYGSLVKSTRSVSDLSGIATALAVAGVALIAYALNGVRLVKFGAGSLNFDAGPEVNVTTQQTLADVPGASPAPLNREAVPVQVIADAIAAWPPEAGDPPTDLDHFESASHREGRGSHPWFLKFRDRPVVRVFYGGRGRTGPHVSSREPD